MQALLRRLASLIGYGQLKRTGSAWQMEIGGQLYEVYPAQMAGLSFGHSPGSAGIALFPSGNRGAPGFAFVGAPDAPEAAAGAAILHDASGKNTITVAPDGSITLANATGSTIVMDSAGAITLKDAAGAISLAALRLHTHTCTAPGSPSGPAVITPT